MRPLYVWLAGFLVFATPSPAAPFSQPAGTGACVHRAAHDGCARAGALSADTEIALSPDGRFAYVVTSDRDTGDAAVLSFRRSTAGRLRRIGCQRQGGRGSCRRGRALSGVANVQVSPDGRHLYATAVRGENRADVIAFRRNGSDGRLTRVRCVHPGCGPAPRSLDYTDLLVAPDGRHVYVSSRDRDRPLHVFERDPAGGGLRRVQCLRGPEGTDPACDVTADLRSASALAISPDGASLYVTTGSFVDEDTIVTLRRDPASGRLQPLPGDRGCVSSAAPRDGCRPARAIKGIDALAVSPDGSDLYASATHAVTDSGELYVWSTGVAAFRRDPADGALVQPEGPAGCFAYGGIDEHGCTRGRGLLAPVSLAFTPDGRGLFVAYAESSALAVLGRDPATGALTEGPCVAFKARHGCARGRGLRFVASVAAARDGRGLVTAGFGRAAASLLFRP